MNRDDYPKLNPPVSDCGGGSLEKETILRMIEEAEDAEDYARVAALKMLLPLFIEEPDAVM